MKPGTVFSIPEGVFVLLADKAPSGHPFHKDEIVGPCVAALKAATKPKPRYLKLGSMTRRYFHLKDALPSDLIAVGEVEPPLPPYGEYYWGALWTHFAEALGKANAPKPARVSPFPKTSLRARLVDDDGVLVLASERALAARYATRTFDYDYPKELVEGMASGALVAWSSSEEGDVTIAIAIGEADDSFRPIGSLVIADGDALLALPYSQLTSACDHHHGVVPKKTSKALCKRLEVPAGTYAVSARRRTGLAFEVFLTTSPAHAVTAPTGVPEIAG